MNPIQSILQKYQDGGEEQRLGLFLTHRDLRDAFMIIEQQVDATRKTTAQPGWLKQLRGALFGWCGAISVWH